MRAALTTGAYQTRSIIAQAQRSINLYAEQNPGDALFPYTYYPTPGLRLIGAAPNAGGWRCLYRVKVTGDLYGVCGQTVYYIDANWTFTTIGTLPSSSGIVSMSDNGFSIVIVDGSSLGWTIDITTKVMKAISDPNFYGATRADITDTFLIFNRPNTNNWFVSLSNQVAFNALDIASKAANPDKLQSVIVCQNNPWLIGTTTSEVWYNVGAADFAFQRMPGVFIEHGTPAPYSVAKFDIAVYWLAQDEAGRAMVVKGANFQSARISTSAIEAEIATYATISDAIGFCYQMAGHTFYQLTFPSADKTWVYDENSNQWHQLTWMDSNGALHRHRAQCAAFAYDTNVCGDWQNGNLYAFDLNTYTDNGQPILRLRSWPHLGQNAARITYQRFVAEMAPGNAQGLANPPQVSLRWSDTRGASWGDPVMMPLGDTGQYDASVQWWGLGSARDRVFELSWSEPVKTALNGAWIDTVAHAT